MSKKNFTTILSYLVLIVLIFGILTINSIESASYGEYLISYDNIQKRSPPMVTLKIKKKRNKNYIFF